MKKLFHLTAVVLVLLLLSSCAPSGYKLMQENGSYYVQLTADEISENINSSALAPKTSIEFSSFEEMQQDFKTGNFTKEEISILRLGADTDGKINLNFALDAPLEAVFPASFGFELKCISLKYGGKYDLIYRKPDSTRSNTVVSRSKDYWESEYERAYVDPVQNLRNVSSFTVINSVTTETERNATVVSYTTLSGDNIKIFVYTITKSDKILHIYETYRLDESETVPQYISILGYDAGEYFEIYLPDLSARPTLDELSVIGLREYVKTEVS